MKKIILLLLLIAVIPGVVAQEPPKQEEPKPIEAAPNAGVIQTLQGKAAGVPVPYNSTVPGESPAKGLVCRFPGSMPQPDPLYVIDNKPVDKEAMKNLKPEDIVSITVLKDAAATSIYGGRAAGGVIIIKTKNGLTKRELRKLKRKAP